MNNVIDKIVAKAEEQRRNLDTLILNAKILQATGYQELEADILDDCIVDNSKHAGLLASMKTELKTDIPKKTYKGIVRT